MLHNEFFFFFLGVVHHDDLMYLFVEPSVSRMFTEDDREYQIVDKLTRMFTAFAYKGCVNMNLFKICSEIILSICFFSDPNKQSDEKLRDIRWRAFSFKRQHYLDIGEEIVLREGLNTHRYEVWKRLFPLNWKRQSKHDLLDYE